MRERTYFEGIADTINGFLPDDDRHLSFDGQRGLFKFGLRLKGRIENSTISLMWRG